MTRGTILAYHAVVADTRWERLVGLLGRAALPAGAGVILPHTPWVHTAFMSFPIDVVFYSRAGSVLRIVEHLLPWRVSPFCRRAQAALEPPAGAVRASGSRVGDLVRLVPDPELTS